MILIGIGLLHLGMTTHPMRVILGLLTVLSGFEILYASLEKLVLVAGLQAVITLGLALVGAYLLAVPRMEKRLSAPLVWIFLPLAGRVACGSCAAARNTVNRVATRLCLGLAGLAWVMPIGKAVHIGPLLLELDPEL